MARKTKSTLHCAALLGGTSSEYLGKRPLPRLLSQRQFVLILGPRGVGKTAVARRVLGRQILLLKGEALHNAATLAVRKRRWSVDVLETPSLLIDGPTMLHRRPGVVRLLQALIARRGQSGLRTVVCQGDGDDSVLLLTEGLEEQCRVTLNLRYPQGRGRVRFASRVCEQLGLDPRLARTVQPEDPWTYLKVIRALKRIERDGVDCVAEVDNGC
jgi:hypothetical protein